MNAQLDGLSVSSSSTGSLGSAARAGGGGHAGLRLLSGNVRQLHQALTALLSEAEREQFTHCLNAYHARRNVFDLVSTLRVLLDSPVKRRLLPMLRLVIPRSDQLLFDQYTAEGLYLPAAAPYRQPAWGGPDGGGGAWPGEVRLVSLRRAKAQEGLGFSIRGGSEHGVGIYVSLVEPGSLAEKEGLKVGDQILRVNDKSLSRVTHAEAVKALKGSKKLVMSVYSAGRIPGGYVTNHIYTWVDPQGRSVSPPSSLPLRPREGDPRRSALHLLQGGDEKKVNLVLGDGRSLGLTIRGGAEYGLGIYVTGVDPGSEAESSGLKVGDQILEVSGRSFLNILHDEAVRLLKSSRHLILTVKDVGRLPHARTTVDETKWIASSRIGDPATAAPSSAGFPGDPSTEGADKLGFYKGPAGSQVTLSSLGNQTRVLLEEQARHLLNEQERATMAYYLEEYRGGSVSVEALVMALFELLNTHAKFSLLSEVRSTISPQDLDRFDHLVLRREIESMKARQPPGPGPGDTYSVVSYSDTGSSTGSHGTSTTVSSARNTLDLEDTGQAVPGNMNALPDVSLDEVKSAAGGLPGYKLPPPPPPPAQPQKLGSRDQKPPSSSAASSHSGGIVFSAPQSRSPPAGAAPAPAPAPEPPSAQDSPSSPIYASISPANPGAKRPLDAHLALVNQHPIGPFPRVQSPPHLRSPPAETVLAGGCLPPPSPSGRPDRAATNQHYVMVEVHRPDSEPDVNEVRALPQARTASTLSQLSDSGQTLSEDSGVDAGEVEASAPGRGRQMASTKSRSSKEPARSERSTEGAAKPPGLLEPTSTLVRVRKSAATLGIAIEGGANTRQPLPRIVTIQRGGSAHNCGQLKVGHVILEVNGLTMRGKEHREAARIIAEAFKTKECDYIDFLVTEFNVML